MAPPSLFRRSTRPNLYVCASCALRASTSPTTISRRWIGMKYLAKLANAEAQWQEKAAKIEAGKQKSMLTILEERGLVNSITGDRDALDKYLTKKRVGAYVGVDPTAASLHVGHLLPLMSLFWMYVHGYHTVSLLGGATAKIGDPTDRLTTRTLEPGSVRTANMARMHFQLKKLWANVEQYGMKYDYKWEWSWHRELVNNNAWWNKLPMLEVLQVLGPGMRLGSMLARDTVKNKMSKGDGMSFAEFSYPLMQAWDWWYMFHSKGINMQIGGSDQYGNITAGIDAIKHITAHHPNPVVRNEAAAVGQPWGFTTPLLTTASGQKFGKSAGNAVWLDIEEMSSYDLYGFFLRTPDADVSKYLKLFTFMPIEQIDTLVNEHMESPSQRKAQHKLAREFVELVHGPHEAKESETQHRLLHNSGGSNAESDPDAKAGITTMNNKPKVNIQLPRSLIYQKSIGKILHAAGIADSASHGHRLVNVAGAYIGGPSSAKKVPMNDGNVSWITIKNWQPEETKLYLIHNDLLLFRKGKNHIRVVQVVSDEEYALSGQEYPGMLKTWRNGILGAIRVKESATNAEKEAIERILGEDGLLGSNKPVESDTAEPLEPRPEVKKEESSGSV
ncbi:tyrosyl-tRNA synthetase [Cadophora gregata]|uniref:tyrosyl-tRNA synthetase n=1 Tax=Cadophora gregata TaxID=51156 RepID=UPI0026DC73BB|nr:tyrosyl-tRNA synthetase [Cadophora gregata]KAK0114325.1 tyrosyl-tRNA synthetase [Cadophora gregata]